jgi:hypothetical protein
MGGDSAHETDEAGPDRAKTKRDEPTTQVKARVPWASADLLDWAVQVTAATAPPGPKPTKNAAIVAALELWASSVLANHPDAARATAVTLRLDPNISEAGTRELCATLDRLDLGYLIGALDPLRVTTSEDGTADPGLDR